MIPITHIPITQIAKGIFKLGALETGHASGPTAPFLIVGKEKLAVIEPGQDGQAPQIVEAIKQSDLDPARVAYIWASHIHLYHVQGVPELLKLLPNAKFMVHPRGAPHMIDTARLVESTKAIFSYESTPAERGTKCYGTMASGVPADRLIAVEDGQVFDLGGREIEIIYFTGHAPHHMALLDRLTRAVWPGDLHSSQHPAGWKSGHDIRPPLFDLDKYLDGLKRLRAARPSAFLTFHEWGVDFSPMETLDWCEELHTNLARICREGMKKKVSFKEIFRQTDEWQREHGAGVNVSMEEAAMRGVGGRSNPGGAIFGMLAFLHRQDPSLEIPADATTSMDGRISGQRSR